ncbi:DUF2730 family protein [Cypionkella psychrotolerans]|uniref:DUF2730 family protein n=1 Tax=Cypionkella psychrotolerans TaxID=1678131 RepID=UPI0006B45522|nr:DUF2730 family protein [Cypionkella psychrotolerans]
MTGEVLNISPIIVWTVALGQLLTFALTIWNLMASGSRANSKRLDDHAKHLDDQGLRLQSLEQAHKSMPTKDDMHSISLGLEGMKGEMKAMRAEMEGSRGIMSRVEAMVGRHDNFLLKG